MFKRKSVPLLLILSSILGVSAVHASVMEEPSTNSTYDLSDVSLNFLASNSGAGIAYYAPFKWTVDTATRTAKLLPLQNDSADGESYQERTILEAGFIIRITDSNNKVLAQKKLNAKTPLKELADWLKPINFRLGEDGIEVTSDQDIQSLSAYSVTGVIQNYDNLSLKFQTKDLYSQFAVVPNTNGIYAKYLDQTKIDISKTYTIYTDPEFTKSVGFNTNDFNVFANNKKTKWRLRYDETKFAYRLSPVDTTFGNWDMLWRDQVDNNVVLFQGGGEFTYKSNRAFWHLQKTEYENQYQLVSMRGSFTDGIKKVLNLDTDMVNISGAPKSDFTLNQSFYLVPN